jgi:hypothetical protein
MRKEVAAVVAVLLAVLLTGYTMYGGLFLVVPGLRQLAVDEPSRSSAPPFEFADVTTERGLRYNYTTNFSGNKKLMSNAGVFVADYDRDGWPDLLTVGGSQPVLFHNANGTFERTGALPEIDGVVRSALFFDYDNDGWRDLLLLPVGREPVFLENREGSFERREVGFDRELPIPIAATAGDYNDDGCLDVLLAQNGLWTERVPMGFFNYTAPIGGDNGEPNYLYRGNCSEFTLVKRSGINGSQWTLATSFVDLTGDGRPDIHIANDFNHDIVYVNEGDGTFRRVPLGERTNRNAMSSEIADVNGDGRLDIFVTNIYYPEWAAEKLNPTLKLKARGNNLLLNRGNATFDDAATEYGVAAGGWGWGAVMADFDNDGDEDLVQATRNMSFQARDMQFNEQQRSILSAHSEYSYPVAWERTADGFENISFADTNLRVGGARGVAQLDFDRDGDLDLVFASPEKYTLYENLGTENTAIQLRVQRGSGVPALGAEVTVSAGNSTQLRRLHSRTDYLAQDSLLVHVGTGSAERVNVTVTFADGAQVTLRGLETDVRYTITPNGITSRDQLSRGKSVR